MSYLGQLQGLLEKSIRKHKIPGAALAVWHDDRLYEAATGVLNTSTGVEVTRDSVFQIGSITKLFTATLCMQLVEQGLLELDRPVSYYIRSFGLADTEAARKITLRHLLSHSSGMAGDIFLDTGDGPDRYQRLIEHCRFLPLVHPVGGTNSYCNYGWTVAAHLAELVSLKSWDESMMERILEPLGIEKAFTHPSGALRYRAAIGHHDVEGASVPVEEPYFPASGAPAGATTSMTTAGLLRFARMSLEGGELDGQRILRRETLLEMQKPHSVIDDPYQFGLGWRRWNYAGGLVIGHDGVTPGQCAFLRVVPDNRVAIALLTNHERGGALFYDVLCPLIEELCGIPFPEVTFPDDPAQVELRNYEGLYDNFAAQFQLCVQSGNLVLSAKPSAAEVEELALQDIALVPTSEQRFVARMGEGTPCVPIDFEEFDERGKPGCMRIWGRLYPRAAREKPTD